MPFPDDIDTSQDYLVWHNTITIGYHSKDSEQPTDSFATIEKVRRFPIRKDNLSPDSPLIKMDRTYRMARLEMKGIVPKKDDIIVDEQGIRWVVGLVENVVYNNEYRCHMIRSTKQQLTEPVG